MYNAQKPEQNELPSTGKLVVSTLVAFVVAMLVLITVIMPAEYGIDPTGVGRMLGLKEMGDIKTSLAAENQADNQKTAQSTDSLPASPEPVMKAQPVDKPETVAQSNMIKVSTAAVTQAPAPVKVAQKPAMPSDQRIITLANGAAAELKLMMDKGAKVSYRWKSEGGRVNYDTHADNATTSYYGYSKGRNVPGDEGQLVAAFDGSHGWFWRNRSGQEVTITLDVQGDYQGIKRVK